jgi:hypothetical protein
MSFSAACKALKYFQLFTAQSKTTSLSVVFITVGIFGDGMCAAEARKE